MRDNTYIFSQYNSGFDPLVILINESTASASEIVAGAMHYHDRALLSEKRVREGLVQSIIPLEFGAGPDSDFREVFPRHQDFDSARLFQWGFYDYYTHGGSNRLDKKTEVNKPAGPEKKTDTSARFMRRRYRSR